MNELSWLVYLADVCNTLDNLFFIVMFVFGLGWLAWFIVGFLQSYENADPKVWAMWRKIGYSVLLPGFLTGTILGSIIPGKDTIYAIAASEMGETALNSETGSKAVKALNHWLDKQIGDEGEPKKDTTD